MNRKQRKTINEAFGEMLHIARIERKITQRDLSELAGITDVYLRKMDSGGSTATWIIWLELCTALEIDIQSLQRKYIVPELDNKL